jgi:hypothetical protein
VIPGRSATTTPRLQRPRLDRPNSAEHRPTQHPDDDPVDPSCRARFRPKLGKGAHQQRVVRRNLNEWCDGGHTGVGETPGVRLRAAAGQRCWRKRFGAILHVALASQCRLQAVKPISGRQSNDGYGVDSGPSRGDPCRRAYYPLKAEVPVSRTGHYPTAGSRWESIAGVVFSEPDINRVTQEILGGPGQPRNRCVDKSEESGISFCRRKLTVDEGPAARKGKCACETPLRTTSDAS